MPLQISEENLKKMQDRMSFLATVINDQSRRIHHSQGIAKEYGPQIVHASIQDLLKEKVTLELQIDTLQRLLSE